MQILPRVFLAFGGICEGDFVLDLCYIALNEDPSSLLAFTACKITTEPPSFADPFTPATTVGRIAKIPPERMKQCSMRGKAADQMTCWQPFINQYESESLVYQSKSATLPHNGQDELLRVVGNTFGDHAQVIQGDLNVCEPTNFLPTARGAAFDSHTDEYSTECHPATRIDLLRQILEGLRGETTESVLTCLRNMGERTLPPITWKG